MKSREEQFILELGKIKDPAVFVGVARILKGPLMNGEEAREFTDVFNDTIDYFIKEKKKRQKELLCILKNANKCKEDIVDGNSSENTAETVSDKEV